MRTTLATLLLLASAVPVTAQAGRPPSPAPPSAAAVSQEHESAPFRGHFRLSGLLFDNFFQAPEGEEQEDVPGGTAEARVEKGLTPDLVGYAELEYTDYRDYRPSGAVVAGVRGERRPHAFDVQAQVMLGRPSREVRDEFDRADGVALLGQYGYRWGDFEPLALAEFRHETYELSPEKANDSYSVGAGLRVRMGKVSPEVGFRWGRRDVEDDSEDLSQRELYFRLRWAPARPTYVSLRVRRRLREYSVEDPAAHNFGREDTRHQLVASGDFFTTSRLGLNVYYSVEDSDSSHDRGEFLTQMLAAGVVVRF
jgi:hypothetical protein